MSWRFPDKIEHLNKYLTEAVKSFCYDHQQFSPIQYKNYIHSHEIYKVPSDYKEDCLYSIDRKQLISFINIEANSNHALSIYLDYLKCY